MTGLKRDLDSAVDLARTADTADKKVLALARYKTVCDVCFDCRILFRDVENFKLPASPPHYVWYENGVRLSRAIRVF